MIMKFVQYVARIRLSIEDTKGFFYNYRFNYTHVPYLISPDSQHETAKKLSYIYIYIFATQCRRP